MENKSFRMWCLVATAQIGFPPDRKVVYAELEQHMNDRYDALIEQGRSPEEATKMTLEAMGNASKIAPQLAAIHRPFWGYALRVCRIALIVMLCLCILPCWRYFSNLNLDQPGFRDFDVYDSASYGGNTGRTLHHLSQPEVSFTSDGYTFTVTDAAVFTEYSEYYGREFTRLYILVQQRGLLPWTETKQYYSRSSLNDPCHWFTARDNLGNIYYSFQEQGGGDPCLQAGGWQTGLFTCTYECWINDFPSDAKWVDICYERDGRSYSMRIHLTGGAGQ